MQCASIFTNMGINTIAKLQKLAQQTIDEERVSDALRIEFRRVFGSSVVTKGKIGQVVKSANEWMDVLDRTGRSSRLSFNPDVFVGLLEHSNPVVRKFAARVAPKASLFKMINDSDAGVRLVVATRSSYKVVGEMLKRFPDEMILDVYKQKIIAEGGIPTPKEKDEHLEMYDERLGDAIKQSPGSELSDLWYRSQAQRFMSDNRNIEDGWEEVTAHRFVSNTKATSGIDIDESKLLQAIKDLIEEREDRVLDRTKLKESISSRSTSLSETIQYLKLQIAKK